MPNYVPYRGMSDAVRIVLKQDRAWTRENYLQTMLTEMAVEYLTTEVNYAGKRSNNLPVNVIKGHLELIHYGLSYQVVNVSPEFCDRVLESRMMVDLQDLMIPHTIFEMCFEDGYELVQGMPTLSCLVSAPADEAVVNAMQRLTAEFAVCHMQLKNQANETFGKPACYTQADFEDARSRRYDTNIQDLLYVTSSGVTGGYLHGHINVRENRGKTLDEVEKLQWFGVTEEHSDFFGKNPEVNDLESQYIQRMQHVALGVVCYLCTEAPDVVSSKNFNRPKMIMPPTEIALGTRMTRRPEGSPKWHLRKAHWRFLRHERFRRDEAGRVRVVWVRETEVNKDEEMSYPKRKERDKC